MSVKTRLVSLMVLIVLLGLVAHVIASGSILSRVVEAVKRKTFCIEESRC
ncbi:MAG: hypothetical protein ACPLPR_08525 [Bacillota bacterium]